MRSRAYLLLERDYEDLQRAPLYGISVIPATDNFLTWIAKIRGQKDSLWEGGALQVSLSYTEEYNMVPPAVIFNTIPFHPNVDPRTGRPCVDFLDKSSDWNPRYSMSSVLLAIQTLLSNPVLENAVNLEAADALLNRPLEYRQVVMDCVKISRQIESGSVRDFTPVRETSTIETSTIETSATETTPTPRKVKVISFEDYHKNWSEIATSTYSEDPKAARPKGPEFRQTSDTSIAKEQYNIIIRGLGNRTDAIPLTLPGSEEGCQDCVFCRLSENCGIEFMGHRDPHASHRSDYSQDAAKWLYGSGREGEPKEEEVDHLVAWTNTLSSELLED